MHIHFIVRDVFVLTPGEWKTAAYKCRKSCT